MHFGLELASPRGAWRLVVLLLLLCVAPNAPAKGTSDTHKDTVGSWQDRLRKVARAHAGQFTWRIARVKQLDRYAATKNDFFHWLFANGPTLDPRATMNCDECILYLHYQSDVMSKSRLQAIYRKGWARPYPSYFVEVLQKELGLLDSRPMTTEERATGHVPAGALVFFDGMNHMALALGKNEFASLFYQPDDNNHLQILSLEELLDVDPWKHVRVRENPFGLPNEVK